MRGDTIVEQRTRPGRSSTRTSTSRQNSVRCGVPYSRLRAATVRRDGRRRRKGGPRVPRSGQACRRGHVVRRHVVHGARSARRRRLLLPGCRGGRCLAAAHVCAAGTLEVSDVTRSCVTLSWLPRRRTAERRSWLTSSKGPSTCRRRGRASCGSGRRRLHGLHGRLPGRLPSPRLRRKRRDLPDRRRSDRFHGRRLTVTVTIKIRPVHSYGPFAYMPAVTYSFRFNNGHLTRLPEHQEHLYLDSVSIQLSVSIYIISVSLHAFLVVFVVFQCILLNFVCYCILIRFNIC